MHYSATYSAEDDKLRLSASSRLDKDEYARVKAAGFGWAPKQEVFYAIWAPSREDLLIELAGEIDDEDTAGDYSMTRAAIDVAYALVALAIFIVWLYLVAV